MGCIECEVALCKDCCVEHFQVANGVEGVDSDALTE